MSFWRPTWLSPSLLRGAAALGGAVLLSCAFSLPAWGKVQEPCGYTKSQAFQTALRYLRVDQHLEIVEKDPDSGYLLFEYPLRAGGEKTSGSVEVIDRDDSVLLVVRLPKLPEYHERYLVEGLLAKLKEDYGSPRSPKKAPEDKGGKNGKDDKKDEQDPHKDDKSKDAEKQPKDAPLQPSERYRIESSQPD